VTEHCVQSLAAGNGVVWIVSAPIRYGNQVLDTRICGRQGMLTEKTEAALREQQSVNRSGRHSVV
jgi:hypothetical protein